MTKKEFMVTVKEELEKSNKGMNAFNWDNLYQWIEREIKQARIDENVYWMKILKERLETKGKLHILNFAERITELE